MSRGSAVVNCARCGRERPHASRGLCGACYKWATYHDVLVDYPRATWRSEDLAADARIVRERGQLFWREVARQLGVPHKTLDKARQRARQRQALA